MSGKDSFGKRRSRRQTADVLRSSLENENEENKRFPYILQKCCDEEYSPFSPEINLYLMKEDGRVIEIEQPFVVKTVYAYPKEYPTMPKIDAYFDMDLLLKKVVCVAPDIDSILLLALTKALVNFGHVFTLRLDSCNLTADQIKILQENLKIKKTIKELSLKENPNQQQNFYCLLNCGLEILNLKCCKINKKGLKQLADEFLKISPDSTLIHLDLSSNSVFDEGCKYIAKILRCDRTLQSLNLTDCKIRDEGFKEIMSCFARFSLDDAEIYERRKLRFEYFKLLQKEKDEFQIIVKNNNTPDGDHIKDMLSIVDEKLKRHPFTSDCVLENGEIFCKGNLKLERLNLSYNRLTKNSLDLILKTLLEQTSVSGFDKGLNRIVLEGNPDVDKTEDIRNAIEELLLSKTMRRSTIGSVRSKGSLKRRKSSAAVSVTSGSNNKDNVSQAGV